MSYVTPANLADGNDALRELSELYGTEPALLAAIIAGGDTSAWLPADVAAAQDVLASIGRFCDQGTGEVDARLRVRGYTPPMDPVQFPVLVVWARAITRYHLHRQRDRTNEETGRIERDYRDTMRALDLVATGKLSLGANDPLAPAPVDPLDPDTGHVRVSHRERLFSRTTLGGL